MRYCYWRLLKIKVTTTSTTNINNTTTSTIEIKLKGELKDNYNKLLLTNDSLNDDKATLTKKLLNNESELIRLNEILNQKVEDDAKNKENINLLMNQVGMIITFLLTY